MVVNEKVDKVRKALEELKNAILTSSNCSSTEAWNCANKIDEVMQQVVSMVDGIEKSEKEEEGQGQTEEKTEVSEGDDGTKTVTKTSVTSSSTPELITPPSDDVMSLLRRLM